MVRVAKAYLNRSKFSKVTKKRIAACINRKSKELNCKVSKPAKVKGSIEYSFDNLPKELKKLADGEIFRITRELVDASIKNEGMELQFTDCTDC